MSRKVVSLSVALLLGLCALLSRGSVAVAADAGAGPASAATAVSTLEDTDIPNSIPGTPWSGSDFSGSVDSNSDVWDVFSVSLQAGQEIIAYVSGASGDADLYLFKPGAAAVSTTTFAARAYNAATDDAVLYQATTTGTHYLAVQAAPGGAHSAYALHVEVTTPSAGAGGRYAVLVGIDDYYGTANDLQYSACDIYDMRRTLIDVLGFSPDAILCLANDQATKSRIQSAFTSWLAGRSTLSTDRVVFHYSGHGTRVSDAYPIDEADGLDECLYVYGSTSAAAIIRDDELSTWIGGLASRNRAIFLDSCYSGGAIKAPAKGISIRVPTLDASGPSGLTDAAAALGPEPGVSVLPLIGDGISKDLNQPGMVTVTASDDTQFSYVFSSLRNGVFTSFLNAAFAGGAADTNSNGRVSVEEAFAWLAPRVDEYVLSSYPGANSGTGQDPQLHDGVAGELELGASSPLPPPPPPSAGGDIPGLPLTVGQSLSGSVSAAAPSAVYALNLTGGRQVRLTYSSSRSRYTQVQLLAPDSTSVGTPTGYRVIQGLSTAGASSTVTYYTPAASGTYYVWVGATGAIAANFKLTLSLGTLAPITTPDTEDIAGLVPMPKGSWKGVVDSVVDPSDVYAVDLVAGTRYRMAFSGFLRSKAEFTLLSPVSTSILSATGYVALQTRSSSGSTAVTVVYTAPVSGVYYLWVKALTPNDPYTVGCVRY